MIAEYTHPLPPSPVKFHLAEMRAAGERVRPTPTARDVTDPRQRFIRC